MANWEKGIIALIANMYCCRLEEGEKSIVLQSFTEGGGQPAYLWVEFSKNKHIERRNINTNKKRQNVLLISGWSFEKKIPSKLEVAPHALGAKC